MPKSTHPVFLSLHKKQSKLDQEMQNLTDFVQLTARLPQEFASPWGAAVSIGAGIRNVYNGMEDIMKAIAKDIDGHVPSGGDWHQDLLDQMAEASDIRPALLDDALYDNLGVLKSFRHVVNHNYGGALKLDKVYENLEVLNRTYPAFLGAVLALETSFGAASADSKEL